MAQSTAGGLSLEAHIELFRRQFLQLENPNQLAYPPGEIVRRPELQAHVYETMFRDGSLAYPPPDRYKLRVLKSLVRHLEHSISDPEEDEISDDLTACLAELLSQPQVPEETAVEQKNYVTYTAPTRLEDDPGRSSSSSYCSYHGSKEDSDSEHPPAPQQPSAAPSTVTLLENRALLAGSGTTGLRTWEAALYLGTFLVSERGAAMVRGRCVLELGAGTGFVSILCAKRLSPSFVLATDGSGDVVDALATNLYLNGLEQSGGRVGAAVLKWGHALVEDVLDGDGGGERRRFELILGADVTYDERSLKPLVATIYMLFERNPSCKVLISATVRNETTVDSFIAACGARSMKVEVLPPLPPLSHINMQQQLGFFHPTATEIRLFSISGAQGTEDLHTPAGEIL